MSKQQNKCVNVKMQNDISVIIPCYNMGATIEDTVGSVLAQTRPAAEMVIVDDGSTDILTRQTLARMDHPRISVIRIEHGGVAAARNHGVNRSRSPYIVLLDADDVLAADYLEKAATRLDADEGLSFVSCCVQAFEGASYLWKPPLCTAVEALTHGTVHISTMFRRSLWDAVGGFDPTLPAYEDMDFWLKAIAIGLRGEVLEEPLLFYRARRNSRYHRGIEPETYQAAMKTIIDKNMHLLNAKGLPVLRAKEAFLVQLKDYQDRLLEERNTLLNDIEALQRQTENIRTALAEKAHSSALQPAYLERSWPPSWELSVPGRCFSDFSKNGGG
jgi:glycosyltransferase involved in cell wall biosynthesis